MKNRFIQWLIPRLKKFVIKHENYQPPYIIEERKVQRITSEHIISPDERKYYKKWEGDMIEHYKKETAKAIAEIMYNMGAIKYEIDYNSANLDAPIKITATTYVPEKL